MFWLSFSLANLAEWTPITTSSLAQACSSFRSSGIRCMQLMQPRVQKSKRTNFPCSLRSSIGCAVLSHWSFSGKGCTSSRLEKGGSEGSLAASFWASADRLAAAATAMSAIVSRRLERATYMGVSFLTPSTDWDRRFNYCRDEFLQRSLGRSTAVLASPSELSGTRAVAALFPANLAATWGSRRRTL